MSTFPQQQAQRSVNLEQMLEIEQRCPNKVIIAPWAGAYCIEDGSAFEVLSGTEKLVFDISANSTSRCSSGSLKPSARSGFCGSDLPILRMRTRRI